MHMGAWRSVEPVGQRHTLFAKFSVNSDEIDLNFKGSVHSGAEPVAHRALSPNS